MVTLGDVAGDLHVVGDVREEELGLFAVHDLGDNRGVGCVPADDLVLAQDEHVAGPSYGRLIGYWRERLGLWSDGILVEQDLVDLDFGEAGDLERHIFENEFLELELEFL